MSIYLQKAEEALVNLHAEQLAACYAEVFLFEDPQDKQRITRKQDLLQYFQRLFALPEVAFTDVRVYEGETWAAIEWTWRGERKDGGSFAIRGASVIEHRGDKILRESIYYDPRPALG